MLANLLDLWKISSKRKPDSSKEEHPNSEKVKNMRKVEFENSNQPWKKKKFPWVKFDEEKKEVTFVNLFCKTLHISFLLSHCFKSRPVGIQMISLKVASEYCRD